MKYKNKEIQDFYSYKCVDVLFVGPNRKVDKLENIPPPTIHVFHFCALHASKCFSLLDASVLLYVPINSISKISYCRIGSFGFKSH